MSHLSQLSGSWSVRRWWATGAGLVAAQVLLLFVFSARTPPAVPTPEASTRYRLLTQPQASQALGEVPWANDPAAFALLTPHGFAGSVWRTVQRPEMRLSVSNEPSRWLALGESPLGVALPLLTARRGEGPQSVLAPRRPAASLPEAQLHPLVGGSTLRLEGGLEKFQPLAVPSLPSWPHTDILRPTVVQLVVGRFGNVESAILLSSSGLAAADQEGLNLARRLRFEVKTDPSRSQPWVWGRVVFRWSTAEPVASGPPRTSKASRFADGGFVEPPKLLILGDKDAEYSDNQLDASRMI